MCKLNLLEDLKMNLPCLQNKDGASKEILSPDEMKKIHEHFKKIANQLINDYCIVKKKDDTTEVVYRFMELEFYYFSSKHPDIITYPRKAEAGDWFFHNSGVDICFESNVELNPETRKVVSGAEANAFGGILIRALSKQEIKDGKEVEVDNPYIMGPLNCCDELFDKFTAFDPPKDFPVIEKRVNSEIVSPSYGGRYLYFPKITLKNKFKNIYNASWKEGNDKNFKDVEKSNFKKYETTFEDFLNQPYCFYSYKAFDDYEKYRKNNKSCKSYNKIPTGYLVDEDTGKFVNDRLYYNPAE